MSDRTDAAPHEPPDDRPGPDFDPAGIVSRVDEDANTVTFCSEQGAGDVTTTWLTVDADHVVDVAECR